MLGGTVGLAYDRIQTPQPSLVNPSPERTVTVTPLGALLMNWLAMMFPLPVERSQ